MDAPLCNRSQLIILAINSLDVVVKEIVMEVETEVKIEVETEVEIEVETEVETEVVFNNFKWM